MNSKDLELKFTEYQRRDLSRWGVSDYEIAQLEQHAVPVVRNYMKGLASIEDTRSTFNRLERALSDSQKQVNELEIPRSPGAKSACRMLAYADYEYGRNHHGEPFQKTVNVDVLGKRLAALRDALRDAETIVELAAGNLQETQRRTEVHWEVVDSIHSVVPMLRPSRGEKSTFWKVVDVCYQAAGFHSVNLEATIKKYMQMFDEGKSSVSKPVA
ncbi:hypothetical protein [Rhodoferax mekongensis]|uniref:hypothetical protein n=1 Tax=Rhodoferax mekongensis TaxID=3068341 RepID=UPI0028BEF9DF|nr:hypothetical protein [Rhodoferax sp. TBRC 17199]MDT7514676.1 hypothetical protein [Rhodoferax sp. TBRC 17199]